MPRITRWIGSLRCSLSWLRMWSGRLSGVLSSADSRRKNLRTCPFRPPHMRILLLCIRLGVRIISNTTTTQYQRKHLETTRSQGSSCCRMTDVILALGLSKLSQVPVRICWFCVDGLFSPPVVCFRLFFMLIFDKSYSIKSSSFNQLPPIPHPLHSCYPKVASRIYEKME